MFVNVQGGPPSFLSHFQSSVSRLTALRLGVLPRELSPHRFSGIAWFIVSVWAFPRLCASRLLLLLQTSRLSVFVCVCDYISHQIHDRDTEDNDFGSLLCSLLVLRSLPFDPPTFCQPSPWSE